jgi:hypothetical protein
MMSAADLRARKSWWGRDPPSYREHTPTKQALMMMRQGTIVSE